jgi:hypothetical protein
LRSLASAPGTRHDMSTGSEIQHAATNGATAWGAGTRIAAAHSAVHASAVTTALAQVRTACRRVAAGPVTPGWTELSITTEGAAQIELGGISGRVG